MPTERGLVEAGDPTRPLRQGLTGHDYRSPLLVLVGLAALVPIRALLSGLSLSFVFVPTAEARYREDVGQGLAVMAGVALLLMVFGAAGIWQLSKESAQRAAVATAVTIAIGMGVTGLGHVQAEQALNPFDSELSALDTFTPPLGARVSSTAKTASETPSVTRHWRVQGSLQDVCSQAERSYREWIGPAAEVRTPFPCLLEAYRGEDFTRLSVVAPATTPGAVLIGLTVGRG